MSDDIHDENFTDKSNFFYLFIAVVALFSFALLPMLVGWFDLLS